ncbi:hypothetical protein B0H17DRAFT_1135959 [Mycena rosella]|uniref:DUF6589 domain-containing protein n=1 Tax=Mycena rosella TaxID=1033263 RepID=A0AAD7DF12_MYCRO|nr:hypothetical protein B0H17DRAFT_1135959 [Mycena rosella]
MSNLNHPNPTDLYSLPPACAQARRTPATWPTHPSSTAGYAAAGSSADTTSLFQNKPATPIFWCRLLTTTASRARKRSKWEKMDHILGLITKDLEGMGNFLELLFHHRPHGTTDVRTKRHKAMVTAFLAGKSTVQMGHIIELIYNHRQSQPPTDSLDRQLAFSHKALVLVGKEARRKVGNLTRHDTADPTDRTKMRASTNGRAKDVDASKWDKLTESLSIPWIPKKIPDPGRYCVIQVGAISSFVLSRNRYANGYLALPLGVWQFACKSHVDEKRIFSRFGFTVHDTTARACLDSLSDASLSKLQESVADGVEKGEMRWQYVPDNVQEWCRYETFALVGKTSLKSEDCAPGAFDLQDHLNRAMKQARKTMTIESLCADIDWDYIHQLTALHWVRILVIFIPQLANLRKEVSAAFDSEKMTKLRLRHRISVVQPLGTNAERKTETAGMMRSILDYEQQMGLDEKALENLIITPRGDGASIAAIWGVKKYLAAHPSHYKAFRNRVPRYSTRVGLGLMQSQEIAMCPTDLKKVVFFPTSRSMTLFYEARVLVIWRIHFKAEDIITYFEIRTFQHQISTRCWVAARTLVRRYASQEAYHQALSGDFADSASEQMKIPRGTPWTAPIDVNVQRDGAIKMAEFFGILSGGVDWQLDGTNLPGRTYRRNLRANGPDRLVGPTVPIQYYPLPHFQNGPQFQAAALWDHTGDHSTHRKPPGGRLSKFQDQVDAQMMRKQDASAHKLRTRDPGPRSIPLPDISSTLAASGTARYQLSQSQARLGITTAPIIVDSSLSGPVYMTFQTPFMDEILREAVKAWIIDLADGPGASRHGFVIDGDHSVFRQGLLLETSTCLLTEMMLILIPIGMNRTKVLTQASSMHADPFPYMQHSSEDTFLLVVNLELVHCVPEMS